MLKKLLTLCLILFSTIAIAQDRIALVIGNSDYKVSPLKNAINDAEDITLALKKLNFDVTLIKNANKREMKDAIYDFSEDLTKDTVGLFYYAGHAAQYHGENYLIPINALSEIKKQRHLEDEAVRSGIVAKEMELSESSLNFIFLDACRDNPLPTDSRGIEQGLVRSTGAEGSLIAFSTSPGRTAEDGVGRNSPYTKSLLKFINTPNQPVELMLKDVKEEVANETNGNQLPWYESSITGNFCFKTTSEGCAEFVQIISDPYLEGVFDIETLEFENGDKYTGQVKNGLMHGKGVLIDSIKIKHQGFFANGLKNGEGIVTYPNGNIFTGFFKDGLRHGNGITKYISGAKVETIWEMGKWSYIEYSFDGRTVNFDGVTPDGYGILHLGDGTKINGLIKNWEFPGDYKVTKPNGDYYEGQIVDFGFGGIGKLLTSNGEHYEGTFKDNKLHGEGLKIWPNGDKYIGNFKNGYMHGFGTKTLITGEVRSGNFTLEQLNGKGTQDLGNGNKYIGEFKNGEKHGLGKRFFNNGNYYEGEFKFDLMDGKGKYFYSDGAVFEGEFIKTFNQNGITIFSNGDKYDGESQLLIQDGKGTYYWKNGDIYSER